MFNSSDRVPPELRDVRDGIRGQFGRPGSFFHCGVQRLAVGPGEVRLPFLDQTNLFRMHRRLGPRRYRSRSEKQIEPDRAGRATWPAKARPPIDSVAHAPTQPDERLVEARSDEDRTRVSEFSVQTLTKRRYLVLIHGC